MNDFFARVVLFQIGLGRIGNLSGVVDQNVVPGLVAIGLGSVGRVPGVIRLTAQIEIHHYAAVAVAPVPDQLTRLEKWFACYVFAHGQVCFQ